MKLFILFSLQFFMLAYNCISLTDKAVKIKKEGGGGTWEQGYICPRLRFYHNKEGESGEVVVSNVMFFPSQIVNPENDSERSGIYLKFERSNPPYGMLLMHLVPIEHNPDTYILPYRHIRRDVKSKRVGMWSFFGLFGGGRHNVLMVQVRDMNLNGAKKKKFVLKITLPYKGNKLLNINHDQISKIIYYISDQKIKNRYEMYDLKRNIILNLIRHKTEKSILDDLKAVGIKQEYTLNMFSDRLEKLNAKIIKPKIVNILLSKKIDRLRFEEIEKQFEINLFKSVVEAFNLEMELIEKNYEEIHNLKKITDEYISNVQNELKHSEENLTIKLNKVISHRPEAADFINNYLKVNFFEEFKLSSFIRRISRVCSFQNNEDN